MGRAVDEATDKSIPQIGGETPGGKADVDLEDGGKEHIRERESRPASTALLRLRDSITEIG